MKRIVAALSAVALIGCSTVQKKPDLAAAPKQESATTTQNDAGSRAAKGAGGGAVFGAGLCLSLIPMGLFSGGPLGLVMVPVAVACLPVGAVAGAVVGSTVAAVTTPASVTRIPIEPTAVSITSRNHKPIGRVEVGDVLPPGDLYVAMSTLAKLPDNRRTGFVVVNFDAPTGSDERSYAAYVVANCDTGTASIRHSITYKERDGDGSSVKRGEHNPHIALDKPSGIFGEAIRAMCEAGPWWTGSR